MTGHREDVISVAVGQFGALAARGLRELLGEQQDLRLLAVGLDLRGLEVAVTQYSAQVVVLDEESVAEPCVLQGLHAVRPNLGVVILAHRPTRAYGLHLLAVGVSSCLSKDAPAGEILRAVHLAAEGKQLLAAEPNGLLEAARVVGVHTLTVRERAVLELLGRGASNGEIALELQIGIETARTHVAHIYRKLGVSTRRDLVGLELPDGRVIERRQALERPQSITGSR
jgi:DNA-binding NarL/FixJ family response regulator